MRISDNRYARERSQFELALRMIAFEARTCTIRTCTGLSDDRIRKIYGTYFKNQGSTPVRRQRGKPPTCISVYVRDEAHQGQTSVLALLYCYAGLMRCCLDKPVARVAQQKNIPFGHKVCQIYEAYSVMHSRRLICFERTWFLFDALVRGDELQFTRCESCASIYVHDALALPARICPGCRRISGSGRRGRSRPKR